MLITDVLVGLSNRYISIAGQRIVTQFREWINVEMCMKDGLSLLYETEPHITLISGLRPARAVHEVYRFLTVENRELYDRLRESLRVHQSNIVVDTFDGSTTKVLKINFEQSPIHALLQAYSSRLSAWFSNEFPFHSYRPHATLTFLKPETPPSVIDSMIRTIDLRRLEDERITEFIFSNGGNYTVHTTVPIEPKTA